MWTLVSPEVRSSTERVHVLVIVIPAGNDTPLMPTGADSNTHCRMEPHSVKTRSKRRNMSTRRWSGLSWIVPHIGTPFFVSGSRDFSTFSYRGDFWLRSPSVLSTRLSPCY